MIIVVRVATTARAHQNYSTIKVEYFWVLVGLLARATTGGHAAACLPNMRLLAFAAVICVCTGGYGILPSVAGQCTGYKTQAACTGTVNIGQLPPCAPASLLSQQAVRMSRLKPGG